MAVNSIGSGAPVMNSYMYQYRNGKGKGMGDIMKQLSPEQRQEIRTSLQSIPEDTRKDIVNQIKQLDYSSLTSDELYNSIMEIINNYSAPVATTATGISITA